MPARRQRAGRTILSIPVRPPARPVSLDECQGVVGQIIDDEAFTAHHLPVVLQDRFEVLYPVAGAESVELVELPRVRMTGILRTIVPFAEGTGQREKSRFHSSDMNHVIRLAPDAMLAPPQLSIMTGMAPKFGVHVTNSV